MEEYPEELRTPPVSLVALFGYAELHASITKYLHSQQPPINALAFPDFSQISLLLAHDDQISRTSSFRDPLSVSDSASPIPSRCGGILKRDWLLKHRTKVPALVAAFFPSHHIFGDPTQWLQVCSDLDSLKSVIRPKNIKLVVVVVQSSPHEDISDDRLVALRKRAELDSKYVLFFNSSIVSELTLSLSRYVSLLFYFAPRTRGFSFNASQHGMFADSLLLLQSWHFLITEKKDGESKAELRKGVPILLI
jgi:hypothetical protein